MNLSDEWYLVSRLKLRGFGANTFSGVTDVEQRRESVRAAIRDGDIGAAECWRVKGKSQTFAEAFKSVYAEEL